jgi:hypothetical protein
MGNTHYLLLPIAMVDVAAGRLHVSLHTVRYKMKIHCGSTGQECPSVPCVFKKY